MWQLVRLAWRSIWRNKRRTIITVASIGLGLSFAVFMIALADGVYAQLVDDAVRMQAGHVILEHPGYRVAPSVDLVVRHVQRLREAINHLPGVERTQALVVSQGVARSGRGAVGVMVLGVEPEAQAGSSPLARKIVEGRYLAPSDHGKVVVGRLLAERLEVGVGKKLVLTTNDVRGQMVEDLLRVAGIYETGAPELDGYVIQLPIGRARALFGMSEGEATQVGVILTDPDARQEVLREIRSMVHGDDVEVQPWEKVLPDLATYIRIDRGSNLVFQWIILFLIGFTIFNTLLMSVMERRREFAMLVALGTPLWRIRVQVLIEAGMTGLVGVALGLMLGGGAAWWAQVHGIDLRGLTDQSLTVSSFVMDPMVHARVTASLLTWLGGLVFGATLLLSLYTMGHAVDVEPARALR